MKERGREGGREVGREGGREVGREGGVVEGEGDMDRGRGRRAGSRDGMRDGGGQTFHKPTAGHTFIHVGDIYLHVLANLFHKQLR